MSATLKRPRGLEEIVATFGDPSKWLRKDGTLLPGWETRTLAQCSLPRPLTLAWDRSQHVTRIRCHRLLVDQFSAAFDAVDDAGLWGELEPYGGCYNVRAQRGSTIKWSTHTWGIAIDLDVIDNPLGATPKMHPTVVQAFEAQGFYWGGRFTRPDGMHFQLAENY